MATSETVTPEARGKAAARDRWLAQMGGLRKNGTFRKGKMRGKTYDQANQEFEGMWTNAPEALKESYAQHARSGATKSEVAGVAPTPKVTNASLNATKPGETTAQAQERFRQSRTGVKPTPKVAGGNSFADLTKAPVIPEGGVNSVGNSEFEGGEAVGNWPMLEIPPSMTPAPVSDRDQVNAINFKTSAAPTPQAKVQEYKTTPFGRGMDAIADDVGVKALEIYNSIRSPFRPESDTAKDEKSLNDAIAARDLRKTQENTDRAVAVSEASGKPIPPVASQTATQPVQSVAQPVAQPQTPTTPSPIALVDPSKAKYPGERVDGLNRGSSMEKRQAVYAPKAGEELTGMKGGIPQYSPKVAAITATPQQMAGAQRVMEGSGMVSMQPRTMATPAPALPPRGPASQPERTGSVLSPTPSPRANDPDIIRKDNVARANYQSSFTGGNPDDASFNAAKNGQKKLYDGASEMDKARLVGNSLKNSTAVNNSVPPPARQPVSSRVVAQRPATPEESRTGKVGTPTTVNAPRATVVPGVQPARQPLFRR